MDKVVCCVLNYAPHYRAEIYTLLEKECNCTFYFGNETLAKNLKKMDYALFKFPPKELKFIKFFGNISWLKGSVKLSLSSKYDAFILTGELISISSWVFMIICRMKKKPVFVWTHGWYGKEKGLLKWLKKLYFNLPNGVFLYGEYARNLMIAEGFNPAKLSVIYNSVAYNSQLQLRSSLSKNTITKNLFENKLPTVIFIGRITIQKKIHQLIDALKIALDKKRKGFNILVIGDGDQRTILEKYIEDHKLSPYVHFLGSCYDEVILAAHIHNADLCVSPGQVGLTGIHCLGYGTPVITHNNFITQMPEFEAIVDGKNGTFFRENDVVNLEEVICGWLEKYPEKTEEIINNCFEIIDTKFNPTFQLKVIKERLTKI